MSATENGEAVAISHISDAPVSRREDVTTSRACLSRSLRWPASASGDILSAVVACVCERPPHAAPLASGHAPRRRYYRRRYQYVVGNVAAIISAPRPRRVSMVMVSGGKAFAGRSARLPIRMARFPVACLFDDEMSIRRQ